MEYIAHIREDNGETQSIIEHSLNTSKIASSFAIDELKSIVSAIGLLHDIGKYQKKFQKKDTW